jgi:ADP-heptose:LPS heptosyltransferase
MGDVAMSVPVINSFREQYPEVELALLTRKTFNPFFKDTPNLKIINPDFNKQHKGLFGIYKLSKSIKKDFDPNCVIDLHDVLRTKLLRFFFKTSGTKSTKIDKGRKQKRELVRYDNKILKPLKHSTQRYADCFRNAGFEFNFPDPENCILKKDDNPILKIRNIGIAPFAKHLQKQYPLYLLKQVIGGLIQNGRQVYIFGGGNNEKEIAERLVTEFPGLISLIGKYTLEEEMEKVSQMDIMLTGDSANMHIAALMNTKIVSVWGATHPYAGFTPYATANKITYIQNNNLDCRPCSVFGNKPCFKGTLECMHSISPEIIIEACTSDSI